MPGYLSGASNHIVLVNPSDMGNLGTIIRTAVGFGFTDIGIISPAVDAYNPKVIRGSMGSFSKLTYNTLIVFMSTGLVTITNFLPLG